MNEVLKHYCKTLEELVYWDFDQFEQEDKAVNVKFFPRYRPLQENNKQNETIQGVVNFGQTLSKIVTICGKTEINTEIDIFIYCNGRVNDERIDDYLDKIIDRLNTVNQVFLTKYKISSTISNELPKQPGRDNNNNEVYHVKAKAYIGTL